jgi:hypothetical protein
MKDAIEAAIKVLVAKAQGPDNALAAMQYTQAVANLMGALACLKNV